MYELKIFDEVEELMNALAENIVIAAEYAIEVNGQFNFVLSGGGSPQKLYELLESKIGEGCDANTEQTIDISQGSIAA